MKGLKSIIKPIKSVSFIDIQYKEMGKRKYNKIKSIEGIKL